MFALRCVVFFWLTPIFYIMILPTYFIFGEKRNGGRAETGQSSFGGFFFFHILYLEAGHGCMHHLLFFLALTFFGGWVSRVACVVGWSGERIICPLMIYYSYTQLD